MFQKWRSFFPGMILVLVFTVALTGCGGNNSSKSTDDTAKAAEPKISSDPVTLKVALPLNWVPEDVIKKYMEAPVQKKYPNISFEFLDLAAKGSSLDELIAAGTIPDIVMTASPLISRYTGRGLELNMEPLAKKFNFDLSRLNKTAVDAVKIVSQSNDLIGIPWMMNSYVTIYNKDIFDKFGVAYPHDGMTWEEMQDLGRKLTRFSDNVQYRGFEPDTVSRVASVLSLGFVDPKTKKAIVNNDGWKNVLELLKNIYEIPGNGDMKPQNWGVEQFTKDKTLAMFASLNFLSGLKDFKDLNWDMVQYPSFKQKPNTGMQVDEYIFHITSQSKHQDEAFYVLSTLLSDEVQTEIARDGRFPVLTVKGIQDEYAKNLDYAKGKNVKAAFLTQPALPFPVSKYDNFARDVMDRSIGPVIKGEKDINTVLLEAEETINKEVSKGD